MTHRKCLICEENTLITEHCRMQGLLYVRCAQCGLIYVDRFATPEQMMQAYTGGGLKSLRRRLFGPLRKLKNVSGYVNFKQRAVDIFAVVSHDAVLPAHGKRFLDIGCNKGFLLAAAVEQGFDVYGVELVKELIRPFKNTYPRFAKNISSEKFSVVAQRFSENYFDIISAIDVIEHFEYPIQDTQNIYRMLKPGGRFVIQTPDVDCAQAKKLACGWGALKPLEHLHLFGRQNFPAFAAKIGFRDVRILDPFEDADGNFVAIMRK